MEQKEAITVLKKYNSWRRGKGKKYAQPWFPKDLTPEVIGQAIDYAIEQLGHGIGKTEFIVLTDMARHGQKSFIADGCSKDNAKAALSAAGKVCRRLDKVA